MQLASATKDYKLKKKVNRNFLERILQTMFSFKLSILTTRWDIKDKQKGPVSIACRERRSYVRAVHGK